MTRIVYIFGVLITLSLQLEQQLFDLEKISEIDTQSLIAKFLQHEQIAPLKGVDHICTPTNTVNGTCLIKDKSLRFTSDFEYEGTNKLVF